MRSVFGKLEWVIGFPAIVLAVAAGTAVLADYSTTWAAATAFGAAVLTAFQTWAKAAAREPSHRQRMAQYGRIAAAARTLHTLELSQLTPDQGITKLKELQDRFYTAQAQPTFAE